MKVTNATAIPFLLPSLGVRPQTLAAGAVAESLVLAPSGTADAGGQPLDCIYLANTSEVLRSARDGALARARDAGLIVLEETYTLTGRGGASDRVTVEHPYTYGPMVMVLREVSGVWADATGTYDLWHNVASTSPSTVPPYVTPRVFSSITLVNTTPDPNTYFVRFL